MLKIKWYLLFLQSIFMWEVFFQIPVKAEQTTAVVSNKGVMNPLKICTTGGFVPFSSYANGSWIGFDIEMIKEFAKDKKVKLKIINFNIDEIFQALNDNKCDLIAAGITITDERKKNVIFSDPYYTSGIVYLYKKLNHDLDKIQNIDLLNEGKFKVGVKLGTTNDYFAVKYLGNANILKFSDYNEVINSVKNDTVDFIIVDLSFASFMDKKSPGTFVYKSTPEDHEYYAIAARKNSQELIQNFNEFLKKWHSSGKYEKVLRKYFN